MDRLVQPSLSQQRKPYSKPSVVFEARLEAQAGSPIGSPLDGLNPDGVGE